MQKFDNSQWHSVLKIFSKLNVNGSSHESLTLKYAMAMAFLMKIIISMAKFWKHANLLLLIYEELTHFGVWGIQKLRNQYSVLYINKLVSKLIVDDLAYTHDHKERNWTNSKILNTLKLQNSILKTSEVIQNFWFS